MLLPKSLERFIDSNVSLQFGDNSLIYVDEQERVTHIYSQDIKSNPYWWGAIGVSFGFKIMGLRGHYNEQKRTERYQGVGGHCPEDASICKLTLRDSVTGEKFGYKVHMITRTPPTNIFSLTPLESVQYNEGVEEHKKRFRKIFV